jgi:hypothetical protein
MSSKENPTGCEFEERFGYAYRVLKKERSKRLVVDSVAIRYCDSRLKHESILRPAAPEFATSIRLGLTQAARDVAGEDGRDGETPLDRTEKHRHDRRDGDPGLYF